jgi:outer membrane protein OmpA-like peptidoglycan-associated protein
MYSTSRLALAGAILLSFAACNSKNPPPPPPPPVAANTAACPDTPPGTKVGPMGCPCDMTVQLQSDSADLAPEDQTRLDQVAQSLSRLHWISGTIEGYTDATQQAEANQKLSEQRAASVRDYLLSKGVGDNRMKVVGYGESNPIADNSTPEGRALNRRVVLRRMDCDEKKP